MKFFQNKNQAIFSDFARIWSILTPALRRAAIWVFCCIFIQAVLEVVSILSISFLALSISMPEMLWQRPQGQLMLRLFPVLKILENDPRLMALASSGAVVLLIAAKNIMFAYVSLQSARFGEELSLDAGSALFREYLLSPYIEHLAGDSSVMFQSLSWRRSLAQLTTDLMNVYTYFTITVALSVTVVVFTPWIILLVIIFLAVMAALVYKSIKKKIQEAGKNSAEMGFSENKVTLNAMRGIRETLIYQQQPVFYEKFRSACLFGLKDRTFLVIAAPMPTWVLETAGFFVIFAAIFLMMEISDSSMARITTVVTIIMLAAWRVLPMLNRTLGLLISIQSSRHGAMQCLSSLEEAIKNPAPDLPEPDADFHFQKAIELRGAVFSYSRPKKVEAGADEKDGVGEKSENNENKPKKEKAGAKPSEPSLKNINMLIPRGKRIGIVGRSGAGKSTLILLLSGLAAPREGQMLVDGRELSGSTLAAYRKIVGFVPQNPYIMGGSIAENVSFSQWGLPWDDEKVLKACRMAEFDVALERGINAGLGQDGAGLSGGQAQRLSIARALYAEPQILIFDEATSALDSGVEKAIMETIYSLPGHITTITIAHRLDTVRRCDIIYWLEKGEIRACGTPGEILPAYSAFLEEKAKKRAVEGGKSVAKNQSANGENV